MDLVSGYLRDIALRKQLEEKVKEATRVRQDSEQAVQDAEGLIARARKLDASTTEADIALTEATAALGAKDYKIAYEKAILARDKATRIYRDRIRSIIEDSETLVAMTRRVGSDVADNDSVLKRARESLDADDFEGAVELASRAWKRSEKMLHEHLSESFSKAQSLILSVKKLGKDTGTAEDLLSRARQAVESNEFEMALTFTAECLDTVTGELRGDVDRAMADAENLLATAREMGADVTKMGQLIERARDDVAKLDFEKALNAIKQSRAEGERSVQKGLESRVANFAAWIEKAEGIGANATEARGMLQEAERAIKEGRYQEGATLARKGFQALQETQFQRVLQTIVQGRDKFLTAKSAGADLTPAMNLLQQARQVLQQGDFAGAIDLARRAEAEVERSVSDIRGVDDVFRSATKAVAEAEAHGAVMDGPRRLLESARAEIQRRNFGAAREHLGQVQGELERASYERAMEIVEKAEFLLSSGERMGADLSAASQTLEEAIVAAKGKDYARAMNLATQTRDLAESAIQKRLSDGIAGLTASLQFLGPEAANVRTLSGKAESALAAKDLEGAYAFLDEANRLIAGRTKERAIQFHETLRNTVELGKDLGADMGAFDATLREANQAMDTGRFGDMIGLRERAGKGVASVAESLFDLVKQKVVQVKNLRVNIEEMRDLLKGAKTSLTAADSFGAIRLMREANEKANRILDLYRATHHEISSAAALVAEAKKKDVDVTRVLDVLVEAKRSFERLEFERALELAKQSKVETEKLMVLYMSAQRLMSGRERLEVANRLRIGAPDLAEKLNLAKEAMKSKDYERAHHLAEKVEEELAERIRDRIAALLGTIEEFAKAGEGPALASLSDSILRVRGQVDAHQYGSAVDLVLQLLSEVEKTKKMGDQSAAAIRKVRDSIFDVETMQIDPASAKKLLEKAEKAHSAGRPAEAIDVVNKAIVELDAETERAVSATMKRFEESIQKARRDGIDNRAAEKMFEQARGFLKERKFRQALALAVQSEGETERASLQQDMATKALQGIEQKVGGFGHPMPPIQGLVKEGKAALAQRDYVKALDIAIQAGDEFREYRENLEETLESRARVDGITKILKQVGGDSAKIEALTADADSQITRGNPSSARDLFQDAYEKALGECQRHLKEMTDRSQEIIGLAQRLRVDISTASRQFSEAKAVLEGGDFERAFQLIQDGRKEAQAACAVTVTEMMSEAEGTIEHAKKLGADVGAAEELASQARRALDQGRYEEAVALIERARDGVESRRLVEKRFVELTYKAESAIRSAKKFGIDARDAERVLQGAIAAKKTDIARALSAAEDAVRLAWQAVEGFAPNIQASLEVQTAKLERWSEATLILSNTGKALAKDVKIRIMGDVEIEGLKDLAAIRAKGEERLPVKVKMTAKGVVPLVIRVESRRVLDDKEYVQEMIAQVEVSSAQSSEPKALLAEFESRCPICKGLIRKGFAIARCSCGRDFHELCASRVGRCPVCFRPLEAEDKKRMLAFRVG